MHERLRTHAESVAFFGGGAREKVVSFLDSAHFIIRPKLCSSLVMWILLLYYIFLGHG